MTDVAVSVLKTFLQEPLDAGAKDRMLAVLGVITLDHAHASKRFRQASRDFRIDFSALAENGPNGAKRLAQSEAEYQQKTEGNTGHHRANANQNGERDDGGHQSANELHQPSADQVAHAFNVAHDARHQHPRLVGVVVGN